MSKCKIILPQRSPASKRCRKNPRYRSPWIRSRMETSFRQRPIRKPSRSRPAFERGHHCSVSGLCHERFVTSLYPSFPSMDKLVIAKSFQVDLKKSWKIHVFPKSAWAFNVSIGNLYSFFYRMSFIRRLQKIVQ